MLKEIFEQPRAVARRWSDGCRPDRNVATLDELTSTLPR